MELEGLIVSMHRAPAKKQKPEIMIKQTTNLFIGIAIVAFGLTSCQSDKEPTQQDIVKKNVEEYLKPKMNDPESYEFVELKLTDSVLYSDNVKYRKEYFEKDLKFEKGELKRQEKYKNEFPSMYSEEKISKLNAEIEKIEKILSEIDRLSTELGDKANNPASYTYYYSLRGNNKLGAKVLSEYILQTSPAPDFKVLNLADNKDQILLNPNEFPGYREMIKTMLGY
ncbi:hypothetical protein [Maribacter sp. ACAM166]|uniref:hypothetical protein n=1 Tax=Maribacter sp. ACAM166 TaxID=2508996 RepID=UPI0010FCFC1E|nr:hypothetical protein [Maribacter sp. ACAM166]TLP75694.1 hypothetical protein ES765_14735 [Maribacter sp. ACAM166]